MAGPSGSSFFLTQDANRPVLSVDQAGGKTFYFRRNLLFETHEKPLREKCRHRAGLVDRAIAEDDLLSHDRRVSAVVVVRGGRFLVRQRISRS